MSKILVIEDEAAIRRVLVKILSEENDAYKVEEAEDGLKGLETIKNTDYDLVLCKLVHDAPVDVCTTVFVPYVSVEVHIVGGVKVVALVDHLVVEIGHDMQIEDRYLHRHGYMGRVAVNLTY